MQEESRPPKPKKNPRRSKHALYVLAFLAIAISGVGGWFHLNRDMGPIPKIIRRSVGFALYYPSPLPSGYSLQKGSVKTANDVVFYILKSDSQTITISEQPAPNPPPDLAAIQKFNTSFKDVNTPAGQAILGIDLAKKTLAAILLTNTTLVSLSASKNVPTDVMIKVVQNMSSLIN